MAVGKDRKRVAFTVDEVEFERIRYWAERRGCSINEYVAEAVHDAIRYENRDYDLPTAEVARLNQLVDGMAVLSSNVASLERVVTSGFESLLQLTRGTPNYLLDEDDGEL